MDRDDDGDGGEAGVALSDYSRVKSFADVATADGVESFRECSCHGVAAQVEFESRS
jgi:hypothetical protein